MTDHNPFSDRMLSDYSRKIFGFALSKTAHEHNAKDLAQEILFALYRSLRTGKQVDNMDAWVHTICCYTWSNYVAKEKRHWHHVDLDHSVQRKDESAEAFMEGHDPVQEQLRVEIAYLSRLHREMTVRYYYDRQSVGQIAKQMKLATGTVKWHLFEVRKKLKEALQVENAMDQLSFQPIKLMVGHSGTPGPHNEPNCYFQSLLTGNVCVAIYEQALSIEDIARKLGVASAYVEDELQKLMKSDLIVESGKGKYRTNFMIQTMRTRMAKSRYFKRKAEELADDLHACVAEVLSEIRATGFHGAQLSDDALLWTLLPYAIWKQYLQVKDSAYYTRISPDERKDGGKYIVDASIVYNDDECRRDLPDYEVVRKYATNGIKSRWNDLYGGLQMESWWAGLVWRDFDSSDLSDLGQAVELSVNNSVHTDYDKMLISRLVKKGFVGLEQGKLECLVPFFSARQLDKLHAILDLSFDSAGMKPQLDQIHEDMKAMNNLEAPSFVPEKDVAYRATNDGMTIIFAAMEYLTRTGKIALPDESEKQRLTTLIWRNA
jgi:RNA polymerase sigma factor (sigma-70 family)